MIPLDLQRAATAGDRFGHDTRQFWAGYEILRGARSAIEQLDPEEQPEALAASRELLRRVDALCREALGAERDPRRRMISGAILRAMVMAWHAVRVPPPPEFEHGSDEDRLADASRLPEMAALFD